MGKENKSFGVSVVIPNWNGIDLLPRCLSQLFEALDGFKEKNEVIIIDDGSVDKSVDYIKEQFPAVKIIQFETNQGFAAACNEGVRQANYDLILVLNNDVFVERNFLSPLINHFKQDKDGSLFAVSCRLLFDGTNDLNLGRTAAKMQLGLFGIEYLPDTITESGPTLYPAGGASLIDRDRFLSLGGFDPHLYYFEDVDIGYRAWKRGWRVLYEPRSLVYHINSATTLRVLGRLRIDTTIAKGRYVFTWKNLTQRSFRFRHFVCLPAVVAGSFVRQSKHLYLGFFKAVKEWGYAKEAKKVEIAEGRLTDLEVFNIIGKDAI